MNRIINRVKSVIKIGFLLAIAVMMEFPPPKYDGHKIQGHKLSRECIEGIILQLRYMSRDERLHVPGLQPGRADIIVSGAEILTSFMDAYEVPHIFVSEQDGMEALQQELITSYDETAQ